MLISSADGGDARRAELVAIGRIPPGAPRPTPHCGLRRRPRDRKRDLARGPGDQDLLCLESIPSVIAHRDTNVKYLIC